VVGYFVLSLPKAVGPVEAEPVYPSLDFFIQDSDVIDYGTKPENTAYFLVQYTAKDALDLTSRIEVYQDVDSKTVFLLHSRKYEPQSDLYSEFVDSLKEQLIKEGYTFNEVTQDALFNLPDSSIILIPSGHIPQELIIGDQTILDLVERENIVIYLGFPFDQALDYTGEITYIQDLLDFSFVYNRDLPARDKLSVSALKMTGPQYLAKYKGEEPNLICGAISSFKIGPGYMLMIPQYLDQGWRNGTEAAEDITTIIKNSKWHSPISTKQSLLEKPSAINEKITLFSNPYTQEAKYAKIIFTAEGEGEGITKKIEIKKIFKTTKGEITLTEFPIYPYAISGRDARFSIRFKEYQPRSINPLIKIFLNDELVKTETIAQTVSIAIIPKTLRPDLDPGTYIITVSEGTTIFGKYLLQIKDVSAKEISQNFNRGDFTLAIIDEDGRNVNYDTVTVRINGKEAGEFRNGEQIKIEGFQGLGSGFHEFSFDFGDGFIRTIEIENTFRPPWQDIIENPINLALAVIAIIAVVIAFYVKRPEKQMFSLDIPDFPPVSAVKIPMESQKVLAVFEKVNKDYSWKNMPLTLSEIKKGIEELSYGGKKIIIGEYNLEMILDKLIARGLVKEKNHYYLLSSWVEKSKKSARYLIMFRMLRDMFLENVVSFTGLGKAKDCDIRMEVSGEKIYLHIYEDRKVIQNALKTVTKGQTILLFDSDEEIKDFKDTLVSPNPTVVSFKLELENENIFLFTLEQLEEFIKTAKVK